MKQIKTLKTYRVCWHEPMQIEEIKAYDLVEAAIGDSAQAMIYFIGENNEVIDRFAYDSVVRITLIMEEKPICLASKRKKTPEHNG